MIIHRYCRNLLNKNKQILIERIKTLHVKNVLINMNPMIILTAV